MNVFIADDHPIFRSGLRFLLEASFQDAKVTEFENGMKLVTAVEQTEPDIIMLDIDMPGKNGLEICQDLVNKGHTAKIVILTMYKDAEMMRIAMFNGASGFLVKDNTSEELVDCLQTVLSGKIYIAREIRDKSFIYHDNAEHNDPIVKLLSTLTRTELKTLKLVSQKLSSREIADLLFVSVKSVENYRSRICKKLNLDARNNSLLMWVLDHKTIIDSMK